MDDTAFIDDLKQLDRAIVEASRDGKYDAAKEVWEQPSEQIRIAWERISRVCYRDSLHQRLGKSKVKKFNELFEEAYRQSVERAGKGEE